MDKATAQAAARILWDMVKYGPKNASMGICFNLHEALLSTEGVQASGYGIVSTYSFGWKHHTGWPSSYPVPYGQGRLWEGRGLELREDLCEYLAAQMEFIAAGKDVVVEIKSARSLRRYRAAGWRIETQGAWAWVPLNDSESSAEAMSRARKVRACSTPTSVQP